MDRRTFVSGVAMCFAAVTLATVAQTPAKVPRIGYLATGAHESPELKVFLDAFRQGLRERGYVEGQNIIIEYRYADGKIERLPNLAKELVSLKVDVIVTSSGVAALGANTATQTIPIVMAASGDAVRQGLVASLARPGGNVTGLTNISPETSRKRLQILREMLPSATRVGVLWCGANPNPNVGEQEWAETQAAAKILGLQLSSLEAPSRDYLEGAFASAAKQRVQAVVMFDCSSLNQTVNQVVELSLKHHFPAMYPYSRFTEAGGLISYGPSLRDGFRRAASYVDKILKGAKPADLPVEQPTKFELMINLKTAKVLGLTIPQSLLLRADEVIE